MFNVNLPWRILRLCSVAHHLAEEVYPHLATTIFHVAQQTRACWSGRCAQDFITRLSGTAGLFALPFPLLRPGGSRTPRTATLGSGPEPPHWGPSRGPPVGVCGPRAPPGPRPPAVPGWLWRRGRRRLAVPGVCAGPLCPR